MDHRRRFSAFVASGCDPRAVIVGALECARDFLPSTPLDQHSRIKVAIIVEELVSNVLRHGAGESDLELWLVLDASAGFVTLEMEDGGAPFDPTAPMRFSGPDTGSGGGIGLDIVHAWADDIAYARKDGRNRLRIIIR